MGLEHQVERTRLGEGTLSATVRADVFVFELVEAVSAVATGAIDKRVAEVREVPRCFPDGGRRKNRRVETDHVVAHLHHRTPPLVLHVAQQQHADGPVVVGRAEPAVNLGGLEHDPPSLGQVHDLVEQLRIGRFAHPSKGSHLALRPSRTHPILAPYVSRQTVRLSTGPETFGSRSAVLE